jgi:hypothetical protein
VPKRCPVALAIRAHTHDGCYVVVGREEVDLEFMNRYACLPTPSKAAKFIAAYDGSKLVVPFEFDLDIPEWALKEAS